MNSASIAPNPLLKRQLKRSAQLFLATTAPMAWALRRHSLLVLMYHRVLPPGDERVSREQPGMWVHPDTFRMHLQTLKQHFEIVRLADWLQLAAKGERLPARACAITFDDGWRDNYEHAYPVLSQEGVPATIFLVADMIGTGQKFWPERLALLLPRLKCSSHMRSNRLSEICAGVHEVNADWIDEVIVRAKQRYSDEYLSYLLDEAEQDLSERSMPVRSLLDWEQVREMTTSGLVDIGSHTRRHVRLLPSIGDAQMREEIVDSRRLIEEKIGAPVQLFCYPNGDYHPVACDLVKGHYIGACSTVKGWHSRGDDPFLIRRIGVHQDVAFDRASFLSRISSWL